MTFQWHGAAFVPDYSGASVPDLHGIPDQRPDIGSSLCFGNRLLLFRKKQPGACWQPGCLGGRRER